MYVIILERHKKFKLRVPFIIIFDTFITFSGDKPSFLFTKISSPILIWSAYLNHNMLLQYILILL